MRRCGGGASHLIDCNVELHDKECERLNLLSVLVSRRLGRVPTLSVCGLWPVSDAPWWRRLWVPCAPWSALPELSERY